MNRPLLVSQDRHDCWSFILNTAGQLPQPSPEDSGYKPFVVTRGSLGDVLVAAIRLSRTSTTSPKPMRTPAD